MNFRKFYVKAEHGIFVESVKTLELKIFFQIEAEETLDHDRFFHRLRQQDK